MALPFLLLALPFPDLQDQHWNTHISGRSHVTRSQSGFKAKPCNRSHIKVMTDSPVPTLPPWRTRAPGHHGTSSQSTSFYGGALGNSWWTWAVGIHMGNWDWTWAMWSLDLEVSRCRFTIARSQSTLPSFTFTSLGNHDSSSVIFIGALVNSEFAEPHCGG